MNRKRLSFPSSALNPCCRSCETAATRRPRSCSATVTSATKLESRARQALRGGPDHALSTSTTLQPLTGKKVVPHRRCGGKCPPPNGLAITRKWASLNSIIYTKWLSPLVALIAWLCRDFADALKCQLLHNKREKQYSSGSIYILSQFTVIKTAGESLNRLLRALTCRRFSCRLPFKISDTTP